MKNNIETLALKILISCNKKPLSRKSLSQNFKRHPIEKREESVNKLLKEELIEAREMPKPNAARTPTFFYITKTGMVFIEQYLESFN